MAWRESSRQGTPSRRGVSTGGSRSADLSVTLPGARFQDGAAEIVLRVRDDQGEALDFPHRVLGPLFSASPAEGNHSQSEDPQ